MATDGLRSALDEMGLDYVVNEGDGAFYGPKIDFHLVRMPSEEPGSAVLSSLTSSFRSVLSWSTSAQMARSIVRS